MTAKAKPARTCAECRFDGGWHFRDDDARTPYRCPSYQAVELALHAAELTAAANEKATKAARQIIADVALSYREFSANQLHHLVDDADLPGSVVGPAFVWAASDKASDDGPLIEPTGRFVQSDDPNTRHRLQIWRSRTCRANRGVA